MNNEPLDYYIANYSPSFLYMQRTTDGGCEVVNVISEKIFTIFYLENETKCCRYCGKSSPSVSFKKKEHIFLESLGNKLFISKYYEFRINQYSCNCSGSVLGNQPLEVYF